MWNRKRSTSAADWMKAPRGWSRVGVKGQIKADRGHMKVQCAQEVTVGSGNGLPEGAHTNMLFGEVV